MSCSLSSRLEDDSAEQQLKKKKKRATPNMAAGVVDDLIDFDPPSEAASLAVDGARQPGGADLFSPEPLAAAASSEGLHQLPAPLTPTRSGSHHHHHHHHHLHHEGEGEGEGDSDATESADSENDMEPPSASRERRRSSSSHSAEDGDGDGEAAERRSFMKAYVEKVFNGRDFDQEEKSRFGELCGGENGKGREWFAKYVSAQRCHSKCVSEATFYRLVQSFAVVLFECYQMDDYSPAKNLMTMCFTYYHLGRCRPSPSELLDRAAPPAGPPAAPPAGPPAAPPAAPPAGPDSYLNKANCWLSSRRDAAERLLKTSSRSNVTGFLGGLESKLRSSVTPRTDDGENPAETKSPGSEAVEEKRGEKVYLYTHLKQQPIWHTLRFWNAAFFDAVHCERRKRSPTTRGTKDEEKDEREKWCHMTQEERDDSSKMDENIAFGQLGTFTHNMLAFGLSKKLCQDFLKKQAVIGNLNQEQYKLLSQHIEQTAAE